MAYHRSRRVACVAFTIRPATRALSLIEGKNGEGTVLDGARADENVDIGGRGEETLVGGEEAC
jgi:hypothetical protein